jgi:hypothetical protein
MAKSRGKDRVQAGSPSSIPASESWLYRNPEAIAAVRRGLQEAAEGKAVSVGSFAVGIDEG